MSQHEPQVHDKSSNDDGGWITESLVQFSRSPVWRTPINNFVDENCSLFDNDEEMKLEYTAIHKNFRGLIDNLLTDYVNELGIPLKEAVKAVQRSVAHSPNPQKEPAYRLLKYLFSMDDFSSFHYMMVRRNIQLDILASQALKANGLNIEVPQEDVLLANKMEFTPDNERLAREANGEADEEEALRLAIEESLKDTSTAAKAVELRDASLQEALAMSVNLEQTRAKCLAEEMGREVQHVNSRDITAAEGKCQTRLEAVEEQMEQSIHHMESKTLASREQNLRSQVCANMEEQPTQPLPEAASPAPVATAAPPSSAPPPAARRDIRQSALPPIQQPSFKALQAHVSASSATRQTPAPAKREADPPAPPKPTAEELEERARYMREQREKILARNRNARNKELAEFERSNPPPTTNASGDPAASHKQVTVNVATRLREDILGEARK